MNIMAGSLGGSIPGIRPGRLSVLSVVINDTCPLKCEHCYLQTDGRDVLLSPTQWLLLLRSVFADLRPEFVCFSGKEVFATPESARLFFNALDLHNDLQKGAEEQTRVGVITNGVLLNHYRDQLAAHTPAWLDISIDGIPEEHDRIRGRGAFAKMATNLPWLIESLQDRLWITMTLMETNVDSLPEIVSSLRRNFGLARFSVGLYQPQTYTSSRLRIRNSDREQRIVTTLHRLREIDNGSGVEVKLEIEPADLVLRQRLQDEGFIPQHGVLRVSKHIFKNELALRVATSVIPVGLWRAVRISGAGQWLAAEDLVDVRAYGRRSVANVADFDYDARKLYAAGLSHPRFRELFGVDADVFLDELTSSA